MKTKARVFVGMSGGVDSSVSAVLLKHHGYNVTGVFIKVWSPDWIPCTWKDERRDAMRVAAHLDIPFITLNLEEEYKKNVVDYMLLEYKQGRTPNPDVMCNKEIKFGSFYKKAHEMGADFIATGHYAQNNDGVLLESVDKNKDQSYFLWTLTKEQLKHVLFPVGHLQKSEVRKLATRFTLPTADKKDSQGICFIGKVEMKEFLEHYISGHKGNVLDEGNEIIGSHDGAMFYTIGQRHGFTVFQSEEPYYVIKKDIEKNTITVAHRNNINGRSEIHAVKKVTLSHINWISDIAPDVTKKYGARIRYRQDKQECTLKEEWVVFTVPQEGVSMGQSVVIYDGEMCVGGGIIESTE